MIYIVFQSGCRKIGNGLVVLAAIVLAASCGEAPVPEPPPAPDPPVAALDADPPSVDGAEPELAAPASAGASTAVPAPVETAPADSTAVEGAATADTAPADGPEAPATFPDSPVSTTVASAASTVSTTVASAASTVSTTVASAGSAASDQLFPPSTTFSEYLEEGGEFTAEDGVYSAAEADDSILEPALAVMLEDIAPLRALVVSFYHITDETVAADLCLEDSVDGRTVYRHDQRVADRGDSGWQVRFRSGTNFYDDFELCDQYFN